MQDSDVNGVLSAVKKLIKVYLASELYKLQRLVLPQVHYHFAPLAHYYERRLPALWSVTETTLLCTRPFFWTLFTII